jgi:hypothetical protein
MKNKRILEYFEGNPDTVYDTTNQVTWKWDNETAISFGYFPISLDNEYLFMTGSTTHLMIGAQAAKKLMGKAISHIKDTYIPWIERQCYGKSYCRGRIWTFDTDKYPSIMAFWYLPSSRMLRKIVNELNIDPYNYILVVEDSQNAFEENPTVAEYIESNSNGDDGFDEINEPFAIDKRVIEIIRSYNDTQKTWQTQKEKEGWKSLAQRNATLYQENRQRVDEYFAGDPDTIDEFDDVSGECMRSINYRDKNVISFGFFQTTLDGGKEFIYKTDICHHDICREIAEKIVGKAIASEDVEEGEIREIASSIYSATAYKGRIFMDANMITTWNRVSSSTLENLLNLMGGVEKWKHLSYIVPRWWDSNWETDELSQKNINVVEYISQNITADETRDKYNMDRDFKPLVDEWLIDTIRQYNQPNSTLAAKTAKLGNMTIAQYNSLIHQEEKEPKQTIKENSINMKDNKYQDYINIMSEALEKEDYKAYEYVKEMLDEAIEDSKHEKELMNEMNTTNFGVLNHIFENELPTLIKTNKKAVRNVIKTIKEDKNLITQFNFYNVIKEQYNGTHADMISSKDALENLAKIVSEDIDLKTVKASNKKLRNIMVESGIKPSDFVDEESRKLYENGDVILTTKRNTNNMISLVESYNAVSNWMDAHKSDKINDGKNPDEMIREFEEKLKNNLNESEMSFVQQITDWRSPIAEQRKEKLFNKFKNECINKINDMLKEDAENVELKGLSDQINEMSFNKETIVKDIAKLLEIRDILMDD